jgi:hypothetical protein
LSIASGASSALFGAAQPVIALSRIRIRSCGSNAAIGARNS